jgi:uncharacterized protein (TIGR02145 family)
MKKLITLSMVLLIIISCKKTDNTTSTQGTVTDVDGNVYHTVTVGTQVWMVENLNTTRYRNGDPIPGRPDWNTNDSGAYCNYNNDENFSAIYGRLYNWYAIDDSRKIAPSGWHVPSLSEWSLLIAYLGGDSLAGSKLKEIGTVHWNSPNLGATNESGFKALPGGDRSVTVDFVNIGNLAIWWSSTGEAYDAWSCSVWSNERYAMLFGANFNGGFSVRCIKDESAP